MIENFENYIFFDNKIYKLVSANNKKSSFFSLINIANNCFLRHQNGYIIETCKNDSDISFDDDSSFSILKMNKCIYFIYINNNKEKYYISKIKDYFGISKDNPYCFTLAKKINFNEIIIIDGNLYISHPPKNGIFGCCSFKLLNSNIFLRHKNGKITNSADEHNDLFNNDSSFICLSDTKKIVVFCSNKTLRGYYISKNNALNLVISNEGDYVFFDIVVTYNNIDPIINDINKIFHKKIEKKIDKLYGIIENQKEIIQNLIKRSVSSKTIVYDYLKKHSLNHHTDCNVNANVYNKICVSVIIPVYNMEKYIKNCLDSVINQTLKEIEIIVIDDGSTDNSYGIIENYANQDSRINIIKQSNQGVGVSRNLGIKIASGEYVCFIDPDDIYPYTDILDNMYTCGKLFNATIVGGEFSIFSDNSTFFSQSFGKGYEGYKFKSHGTIQYSDYQFDYGFHRFIYSKKFLKENDIYFPNYKRFQDPPFFVKSLHKAREFFALNSITYGYRVNHKRTRWTQESINGFIKGITYNINLANCYKYEKLQWYSFYHFRDHFNEFKAYVTSENITSFLHIINLFETSNSIFKTELNSFKKLVLSCSKAATLF